MTNETVKLKTALVTGSNRGIGFAIARGLANRDDIRVLVAARKAEDAEAAARRIKYGTVGVSLDLSDPTEVAVCAREIESEKSSIESMVST